MYRRILVAYNATLESRSALHECVRLSPRPDADIHLLAVVAPPPPLIGGSDVVVVFDDEEDVAAEKKRMQEELHKAQRFLSDAGLHVTTHLLVGEPVEVIEELTRHLSSELLIVGHSRHRSWAARWWKGSTDAILLERLKCSILVAPATDEASVNSDLAKNAPLDPRSIIE